MWLLGCLQMHFCAVDKVVYMFFFYNIEVAVAMQLFICSMW